MDFYRGLENIDKHIPARQQQDLEKLSRKSDNRLLPYKNTCHKATGEYFPSPNDKIKLLEYMKTHPTLPDHDMNYIVESLKFIDEYERKGMFIGAMNGLTMFFFPAIRRLALYKRIPIASVFVFYWFNWGYHYGRDLVMVRSRNLIENWERDIGLRNYQMGN